MQTPLAHTHPSFQKFSSSSRSCLVKT